MSLLFTFREFDQKTFKPNRVLGFMIFFLFSEGRKIPIPEATKLLSIEPQICPSVSIPKRALKLLLYLSALHIPPDG